LALLIAKKYPDSTLGEQILKTFLGIFPKNSPDHKTVVMALESLANSVNPEKIMSKIDPRPGLTDKFLLHLSNSLNKSSFMKSVKYGLLTSGVLLLGLIIQAVIIYRPVIIPESNPPVVTTEIPAPQSLPEEIKNSLPDDFSPQNEPLAQEEQPPLPKDILEYKKPSIVTQKSVILAEIRWCLKENVVLESAAPLVNVEIGQDRLNQLIGEHRSRCGSFSHDPADMLKAQEQTDGQKQLYAEMGRRLANELNDPLISLENITPGYFNP
jgi:hypothetical protein